MGRHRFTLSLAIVLVLVSIPLVSETPENIIASLKKYGMLLSDGGNIAFTFADDRTSTAKWADQGITAQSFAAITVDDFEVVDLSAEIAVTDDCVRN